MAAPWAEPGERTFGVLVLEHPVQREPAKTNETLAQHAGAAPALQGSRSRSTCDAAPNASGVGHQWVTNSNNVLLLRIA